MSDFIQNKIKGLITIYFFVGTNKDLMFFGFEEKEFSYFKIIANNTCGIHISKRDFSFEIVLNSYNNETIIEMVKAISDMVKQGCVLWKQRSV